MDFDGYNNQNTFSSGKSSFVKSTPDQTLAFEQNKILAAIFKKDANEKKKEDEMSGLETDESNEDKKASETKKRDIDLRPTRKNPGNQRLSTGIEFVPKKFQKVDQVDPKKVDDHKPLEA